MLKQVFLLLLLFLGTLTPVKVHAASDASAASSTALFQKLKNHKNKVLCGIGISLSGALLYWFSHKLIQTKKTRIEQLEREILSIEQEGLELLKQKQEKAQIQLELLKKRQEILEKLQQERIRKEKERVEQELLRRKEEEIAKRQEEERIRLELEEKKRIEEERLKLEELKRAEELRRHHEEQLQREKAKQEQLENEWRARKEAELKREEQPRKEKDCRRLMNWWKKWESTNFETRADEKLPMIVALRDEYNRDEWKEFILGFNGILPNATFEAGTSYYGYEVNKFSWGVHPRSSLVYMIIKNEMDNNKDEKPDKTMFDLLVSQKNGDEIIQYLLNNSIYYPSDVVRPGEYFEHHFDLKYTGDLFEHYIEFRAKNDDQMMPKEEYETLAGEWGRNFNTTYENYKTKVANRLGQVIDRIQIDTF